MSQDKNQHTPESHFEDFMTYRSLWDRPKDVIDLLREAFMEGRYDAMQPQPESGSLFEEMGLPEVKMPSLIG